MSDATTDIKIEPLTVDLFAPIIRIEKSVFEDPWSAASFLEVMSFSPNNWVAMVDGNVSGYIVTQWVLDEIHILNVAVAKEAQRQGIASTLLRHVFVEGRKHGMRDLFLEVRVGNAGAIALYERFGFKQLSVRKKYYSNGEDAMVMHCPLPELAEEIAPTGEDDSKTEER